MKKELTTLTSLTAGEVSLVTRGANRKRRFPIYKSEEVMGPKEQQVLRAVLETEADGEERIAEVFKADGLDEKAVGAVKGALRLLSAHKDALPKDVLAKLAGLAGYEYPGAAKKAEGEEEEEETNPGACAMGKGKKEKKDMVAKNENEMLAALPEEVRKQLEPVMKARDAEIEAIKKHNDDLQKTIKAERDERETAAWVAKAEKELAYFPGKSADELGKMLKSLHDVSPDMAKSQFEGMKAASDAVRKGALLSEGGVPASARSGGADSAMGRIQKMVDGLVEKSGDMTREKAFAVVIKNHPGLYQEYLDEHPAQTQPWAQTPTGNLRTY